MSKKLDALYYNGLIRTMEGEECTAEAVGIADGKIAFVGSSEEAALYEAEERIDLEGALVLPGFEDSHLHMLNYAFAESAVKLYSCTSAEEVSQRIGQEKQSGRSWVYGRGWNEQNFKEKRYPLRWELDQVCPDVPCAAARVCGHVAVLNSCALERISELEEFAAMKQDVDMETGLVKETATKLFYDILDPPQLSCIEKLIRLAAGRLNEAGITAVQSDDLYALPGGSWKRTLEAFESVAEKGELTVRVYEQCLFTAREPFEEFLATGRRSGTRTGMFQIGPLKLLQDGSLGARTAALEKPYEGTEQKGMILFSQEELNEMISLAHDNNMQAAVHGIGDRAMNMILKAYGRAQERSPRKDCRHGIVHAQITDENILREMKRLEVMAYTQPVFVANDMDVVEERVGRERMKQTYAWKTMEDMGILAAGGSDAPVEPFNILENIHCAVNRTKKNGTPQGGWMPEQKLTVYDAVKLFTVRGAWSAFEEDQRGTVTVGKWADLVVLDKDIFRVKPEEILTATVLRTVVGGKIVYKK